MDIKGVVLCKEPVVLFTSLLYEDYTDFQAFAEILRNREVIFVVLPSWNLEYSDYLSAVVRNVRNVFERHPLHSCYVITSCLTDSNIAQAAGLRFIPFHQNALLDPDVFYPAAAGDCTEIGAEAIYNAALVDWKRHDLCSELKSVGFIYYRHKRDKASIDYFRDIKSRFPKARFYNEEMTGDPFGRLSKEQVANILRKSRVGLCLSAEEGAMFASAEYLLTGLPVVSTPSIGGRDFFFHSDYVSFAEPTARSVADAVQDILARAPPAAEIRARTEAVRCNQIECLVAAIDSIVRRAGGNGYTRAQFDHCFCDKLRFQQPLDVIISRLPKIQKHPRHRFRRMRKKIAKVMRV